jgi:hypothetical protein
MFNYWMKLLNGKQHKPCNIYKIKIIFHLHSIDRFTSPWLFHVQKIIQGCGLHVWWLSQTAVNPKYLSSLVRQTLKDQFMQDWLARVENDDAFHSYKEFKTIFEFEKYLNQLPIPLKKAMIEFRIGSQVLPVHHKEFNTTSRIEQICEKCNTLTVGYESHLLFECPVLDHLRNIFIPDKFIRLHKSIRLNALLTSRHKPTLLNFAKFLKEGLTLYRRSPHN